MCQFVQSVLGLMAWLCRSQLNSRLRWQSAKTVVDLQLQPWLGTRNCVACAAFDRHNCRADTSPGHLGCNTFPHHPSRMLMGCF